METIRRLFARFTDWLAARLSRLGHWFQDRWAVLMLARFSFFIGIFGAALLLVPQGRELTYAVGENTGHTIWFFVAVTFLAVQAWFWARLALDKRYARVDDATQVSRDPKQIALPPGHPLRRWVNHTPRVLGSGAFLLAAASVWYAAVQNDHAFGLLFALLTIGVFFYGFLTFRRKRGRALRIKVAPKASAEDDLVLYRRVLIPLSIAQVIGLSLWSWFASGHMGEALGAGAVFFLALASMVPVGGAFVWWAAGHDVPAVGVFIVLAVLLALWGKDHPVALDAEPSQERITLADATRVWMNQVPQAETDPPRPLIVVATAGGGIRATHWTIAVLTALEDQIPNFSRDLFAISGVSGGGLGSVAYIADLTEPLPGCGRDTDSERVKATTSCRERRVRWALSADHLAPNLAAGLFPDPKVLEVMDRGRALERSWERSWDHALGISPMKAQSHGLERRFAQLWRESLAANRWLPLVLINGTLEESGQRVVTSPVVVKDSFRDSEDFLSLVGERDLKLSTAAHNGARFTYVSPAGAFTAARTGKSLHVIDGGYFENNGAQTAREILAEVWRNLEGYRVRPVVIQIVSDPLAPLARAAERSDGAQGLDGPPFLNEVRAPLIGFANTRSARGTLASQELAVWSRQHQLEACDVTPDPYGSCGYYVFDMLRLGGINPALGWLLSRESEEAIALMLRSKQNQRLERLREDLDDLN